jgi:hypothetical protein
MTRVQIPAYTDRWARGDRFGELTKVSRKPIGQVGARARLLSSIRPMHYGDDGCVDVGHVRLDKSGKVVRVILADCEVV